MRRRSSSSSPLHEASMLESRRARFGPRDLSAARRPTARDRAVAARLVVLPPAEILRALGEGLALEMEGRSTSRSGNGRCARRSTGATSGLSRRPSACCTARWRSSPTAPRSTTRAHWPGAVPRSSPTWRRSSVGAWCAARRATAQLRLSMLETVREHALDHGRAAGDLDALRSVTQSASSSSLSLPRASSRLPIRCAGSNGSNASSTTSPQRSTGSSRRVGGGRTARDEGARALLARKTRA